MSDKLLNTDIEIIEGALNERNKEITEIIEGFLGKCNKVHKFIHEYIPWKCSTELDAKKLFLLKTMINSHIDCLKITLKALKEVKEDLNG